MVIFSCLRNRIHVSEQVVQLLGWCRQRWYGRIKKGKGCTIPRGWATSEKTKRQVQIIGFFSSLTSYYIIKTQKVYQQTTHPLCG